MKSSAVSTLHIDGGLPQAKSCRRLGKQALTTTKPTET
ncbi:hypothetical protein QII09_gp02 [Pseudomonas phage pf8_ST274-AUS411]|uniref:Uncharacterized protein n=1 Tax=Pseudomonas phage pf8_ST274-AUS411 TaxID=2686285 RepID=A0A6B9J7J4_9VIRU|nr:hypothetical protein QII09_gp02 [Pseudomonas phage pf8_ST274-AUS411]QGZ15327.1 hypothetical protein [Pseudomonas phage pf8_ST274-AUS411]